MIYGTIMGLGLFWELFLELLGYFGTMDIMGYEYWILGYCSGGVAPWILFLGCWDSYRIIMM